MRNLDLHTGLSLDSDQSPRGNHWTRIRVHVAIRQKADGIKIRWKMGQDWKRVSVGIQKVNSPSLLGIQFSTGTLKHKSNQSTMHFTAALEKHTDAVVADRLSKPDVPFICSWQQS